MNPECPMCGPNCVGGAHYNALMEDGIDTRAKWEALQVNGKVKKKIETLK